MKMFCCFGTRGSRAQPASARDRSVLMTSAGVNNVPAAGDGGADSAVASEEGGVQSPPRSSGYSASSEGSLGGPEEGVSFGMVVAPLQHAEPADGSVWPLAFGSVSETGLNQQRQIMEDTVSLRPCFCVWADGSQMHFFAVFDGHGGPQVSALCRDQMHTILAEELAGAAAAYRQEHQQEDEEAELLAWKAALTRSFARVDALGASESRALRAPIMGSTAVVALMVRGHLLVANCGDSRAVLCRAGRAIPLSEDHKLERPDEMARVTAAGDTVFHYNGRLRVRGILAMSRALGHTLLKPAVICEPEITITTRSQEDDCLVLASHGLWGVMSNQAACKAAQLCLGNTSNEAAERCALAAIILAKLAVAKESSDDISVVVLDLKMRG